MSTEFVHVRNNHVKEYTETFKGKDILIPAHGVIKMTRGDANSILRTYINDERGRPKIKMLKIEPIDGSGNPPVESKVLFTCMRDGEQFETQKELDEHMKLHKDQIDKEPEKKDFQCPFCEYTNKTMQGLKSHINRGHKNDS